MDETNSHHTSSMFAKSQLSRQVCFHLPTCRFGLRSHWIWRCDKTAVFPILFSPFWYSCQSCPHIWWRLSLQTCWAPEVRSASRCGNQSRVSASWRHHSTVNYTTQCHTMGPVMLIMQRHHPCCTIIAQSCWVLLQCQIWCDAYFLHEARTTSREHKNPFSSSSFRWIT